ncbi:MAG: hypothetical protein IKY44_01080 [Clostridia bacterium]|nr:hypothetical protein [Clostridia bacterium]
MYIVKNALRCIGRAKGRNILIGIIVLVIAVSSCIGLSIRQAAEDARESALQGMSITATISYDPDIILADEPTGNLDADTQREIMDIFREFANQGKCVILVSHSPEVAAMRDERYELTRLFKKGQKK